MHICTSGDPTRNSLSDLDPLNVDAVLTLCIISTFLGMLILPTARHLSCIMLYLLHAETTITGSQLGGASLNSPVELFPTNYGSRYDHDSFPDDVSPNVDIEVGLMLMFVDSIMIIHAQSDCCGCHVCAFMYDTHWSTDGCAKTLCLQCVYVAICKIVEEDVQYAKYSWHSTLRTVAWGISSPDAMFDGHLHSSCSTTTVITFPLAGVCIVRGPPAFISALGFTLSCHREMFLQLSFAGQCNICSHKSVLAGLLMALTLKNVFQYLSFDHNWTLLCIACLGYTKQCGK